MAGSRFPFRSLILGVLLAFLLLFLLTPLLPRTLPLFPPFSWIVEGSLWLGERWLSLKGAVRSTLSHYLFLKGVSEKLEAVEAENRELRFRLMLLEQELLLRQRYEELWGRQYTLWESTGGRIVHQDPGELYRDLWIHTASPLAPERIHVVISLGGVVGRVIRVSRNFAQVMTLYDPESALDVATLKGTRGVVQGTGKSLGIMRFVPQRDPLEQGEELFTTGKDGFYPPGLRVGWVERIREDPNELFKFVEVRFATELDRILWVKVLTLNRPPLPPRP